MGPSKCDRCDKEFATPVELEYHKSSREYKTPLKICSCKFKSCTLEDMKIHFKLKHSSVIEKTKPVQSIQKSNRETQQEINSKLRQANGFAGEQIFCNFIAIYCISNSIPVYSNFTFLICRWTETEIKSRKI